MNKLISVEKSCVLLKETCICLENVLGEHYLALGSLCCGCSFLSQTECHWFSFQQSFSISCQMLLTFYLGNEHCSLTSTGWGWGRVVSRSTSTQVDRKFSFLAFMDFLAFLLILGVPSKLSVGEADDSDSSPNSSCVSFSNCWSGDRLSL